MQTDFYLSVFAQTEGSNQPLSTKKRSQWGKNHPVKQTFSSASNVQLPETDRPVFYRLPFMQIRLARAQLIYSASAGVANCGRTLIACPEKNVCVVELQGPSGAPRTPD